MRRRKGSKASLRPERYGNDRPRDNASGERMKESVLKWGGGRDPWKCLSEVLDDGRVENGDQKAMSIVGGWGVKGGIRKAT